MQFRLLNFHKMLANFAVNIISVFVPLILFTYTNNLSISVLFLIVTYSIRVLVITLLKKFIIKKPQLCLLIRVVPMLIYASSILLLDYNFWLAVVLICLFGGISDGLSGFSNEVILNYSSLNRGGKSFGLTRLFEQVGVILSVLAGGLFLDNLDKTVVIIISVSFYLISVAPLLYYYIKFKDDPNFNKEAISNALLSNDQKQTNNKKIKRVSKSIINEYFLLYFLMCFIDALVNIFNLYVFSSVGVFAFASLVSASYNTAFGISSYVVGKINEKHDTTIMALISCVIMAMLVVTLPFVKDYSIIVIAIFSIIGGLYPFSSIFLIERMLTKTRILGISNEAIFRREQAASFGKISTYVAGAFGTVFPAFFVIAIAFTAFGILIPKKEEKTRKILVNYLEGN